jgi:drug/metabolite transporter (DMT)-like permease
MTIDARARRRAFVLMVIAPVMWSMAGIFTRHLDDARGFEITFWRSLSAAAFVAVTLFWRDGKGALATIRRMGVMGMVSGAMWASMFSAFMLALTMTTVANTLIVESISPLLTVVFAWLFLKEKAPMSTWAAIGLAFIGMVWMFAAGMAVLEGRHLAGMFMALVVPVAAAINFIVLRKTSGKIEMIPTIMLGGLLSALAMLPLAWPLQASLHDIGIMVLLGIFQLGLPCMLMIRATEHLSAPEISLLAMLEVVLGPIWVWLGVGEVPSHDTLIGGIIILGALILHEMALGRPAQTTQAASPVVYTSHDGKGSAKQ